LGRWQDFRKREPGPRAQDARRLTPLIGVNTFLLKKTHSLGQISHALYDVDGEYHRNM